MTLNDFSDLSKVQRVPHATAEGTQEGRPHPALRRYRAQYGVVDSDEALKLLAKRRSGALPPIKGGLDDMSPDMAITEVGLPVAYAKDRVNPKAPPPKTAPDHVAKTDSDVKKAAPAAAVVPPAPPAITTPIPTTPAVMPPPARYDPFSPDGGDLRTEFPMPAPPPPAPSGPNPLEAELQDAKLRLGLLAKSMADLKDSVAPAQAMVKYISGRVRVEISVNGMTFSLPAVDVIESMAGVVVLLPTAGDSVTFTPGMGADATIFCNDRKVRADTAYTGISFNLDAFGLVGLVFLKRPDQPVRPSHSPTSAPTPAPQSLQAFVQQPGENSPSGEEEIAVGGIGLPGRPFASRGSSVSDLVKDLTARQP